MSVKTLFRGGSRYEKKKKKNKKGQTGGQFSAQIKTEPLRRKESTPAKVHRDGEGSAST